MKVEAVEVERIVLPLPRPITYALGEIRTLGCVLVTIRADDGVAGENLVFSLNDTYGGVFAEMIQTLVPLVAGSDPGNVPGFWERFWRATNFIGDRGVSLVGASAIDGALWDLNGRGAGMPLQRMLGGARPRLPAYNSAGLWLSSPPAELAEEAGAMVAAGWTAIKVRLGAATAAMDLERVRAVRAAIGPDVRLLADANQGLDEDEAIRRGRLLEACGLAWFEEPLPFWDLEGLARVRAAVPMPIASGENEYTSRSFRRMIELGAVDTLMPDLQRVGGVSEFVRVGRMAQAAGLAVSSHLFPETSVQVLASLPAASYLEYLPWFGDLYDERLVIEDGEAVVPDRPGLGFTFNRDYIAHLRA